MKSIFVRRSSRGRSTSAHGFGCSIILYLLLIAYSSAAPASLATSDEFAVDWDGDEDLLAQLGPAIALRQDDLNSTPEDSAIALRQDNVAPPGDENAGPSAIELVSDVGELEDIAGLASAATEECCLFDDCVGDEDATATVLAPSEGADATGIVEGTSPAPRPVPRPRDWAGILPAQERFIQSTRAAIDAGHTRELLADWTNMRSMAPQFGGAVPSMESYCVRRVACWLPHILFKEDPYCPTCGSNVQVSARRKPKWCSAPGIVFGRRNTYFLDTMRYHCGKCSKWFKGTNQQSLEHATVDIITNFPFYLGSRYAVDMELKHYIVQLFPHMRVWPR